MSQEKRRKALLIALALVLIFLGWRQVSPIVAGLGSGVGRPASGRGSGPAGRDGAVDLPEVVDLRIEDLEKDTGHFNSDRDPFRFGAAKEPVPPPPREDSESEIQRRLREAREAREMERRDMSPPAPPVPQPPRIDVVFLGSFGPQTHRLAVFSDGNEIFNVFEGDQLNENFYVVKIGLESADVGFVDFPDAPAQRLEVGG